ncbi:DUF1569 domain-containing protein [Reichenbachiella agarivorans]|uniref:DUF1569 domain-containing protein n=1 Tax=Reichenbachiella agarivorans TaxID=2979464 RepID=A0ABY6CMY2_9BACT|nr:DUF1569 domain-containing protein [Reichenbachiella agarivorans]UXP31842.1 DUF1569 domain-containing protein [Reichenbachiella agarivorans]
MKTIIDTNTITELISRINLLQTNSSAQWGKMDAYQMLKHCTLSEEMFHGKNSYKRLFIGMLFGSMALKGILKNDDPIKKNQPTHPAMKISGTGDFEKEKAKWIKLIQGYESYSSDNFIHPFFGKMTTKQIGHYVYKHTDHHLRQFGH